MPRTHAPDLQGVTIDGIAREVHAGQEESVVIEQPAPGSVAMGVDPPPDAGARTRGAFLDGSFADASGSRRYKVYIPAGWSIASSTPMPMLVMLHGCTQSPEDFAAGTRMNALADEHGFVVVYPAQSAKANAQKCWNWFRSGDQYRESGEPAIIAGITRSVASTYHIDMRRIFVTGMSAGAAMAVILGTTYPDLYAGVGAHSGLAYRAAHDLPSALGAMQGRGGTSGPASHAPVSIPTIVFHGDGDPTVNASNATSIVEHTLARHDRTTLQAETSNGIAGGRTFSRTRYLDGAGRVVVEQWTMHGAGHAWSGGSPAGTFTDARGPDASREMVRFFLAPESRTA